MKSFSRNSRGPCTVGFDLPSELRFTVAEGGDHLHETYLAHDHQIHVARRLFLASCNRAVQEPKLNPILKGSERFVKNVSHSRRLREDAFELDENGALAIRLVEDLIAALNPMEEPCIGQLPEFALGCPYSCSRAT